MILQKPNETKASPGAFLSWIGSGRGIALGGIVIGVAMRLYLYFQHASLWFDEVALALNIAGRSYANLLHPLWLEQSAPLLYLWIERSLILLFGVNEWSLRALSLICGIGVLLLIHRLARVLFGWQTAALAVLLAAFSSYLLRYSNEVKPYGVDAFLALALTILAVDSLRNATRWHKAALFTAGLAAPWLSTPAIFVLGGIGIALLLQAVERKGVFQGKEQWASQAWVLYFLLVSAVSFALAYKYMYAAVAANAYMKGFWADLVIHSSWPVQRIALLFFDAAVEPIFGLYWTPAKLRLLAALPLLAAGIWGVWVRYGLPVSTLFLTPLLGTWAAAYLGLWVLSSRLMLFFSPLVIILLAAGAAELAALTPFPKWRTALFWCLTAIALVLPVKYALWPLRHPEIQSNRQLVAAALRAVQPGDTVYIYSRAAAAWLFYSTRWPVASLEEVEKGVREIEQLGPNSGNSPPRGRSVSHEGFSWRRQRGDHTELLGIANGIQNIDGGWIGDVDPGFAENEAARIGAAGSRRVWLIASEYHREPIESLLRRLRQDGFSCSDFFLGPTTLGLRLQRNDSSQAPGSVCRVPER